MKYLVLLCDGMADHKVKELGNKTPMMAAKKPNMDNLASEGIVGLVKTIPEGASTGSDSANMSVMGYDPLVYHTGRSPIEAVGMEIPMEKSDIAMRCNLVYLSDPQSYEEKIMIDYSSDEITTLEADYLINDINKKFENSILKFYTGISYRHCLLVKNGKDKLNLTPPHDIMEKKIGPFLPDNKKCPELLNMMKESYNILKDHRVNKDRIKRGLNPANSIWLWGEGKKPYLPSFQDKYGKRGSVISAVDLLKGLAICSGLKFIPVEGATGNIHTNYKGKADAAIEAFENGDDFVYLHVEAPDECGHRHEITEKVKSLEFIDEKILGYILQNIKFQDFKIMILPDHPTPLDLRTHTAEPVPFLIWEKGNKKNGAPFDEDAALKSGVYIDKGHTLMEFFFEKL